MLPALLCMFVSISLASEVSGDESIVSPLSPAPSQWYQRDNVVYWWIIAVICVCVFALWLLLMFGLWLRYRIISYRYRTPKRPVRERRTVVIVDRNPLPQQTRVINETAIPAQVTYRSAPQPSRLKGTSGMSRKEYFARS